MKAAVALLAVAFALVFAGSAQAQTPSLPDVTPTITGALGSNGWYVGPVTVTWTVTPAIAAQTAGCLPTTFSADTSGVTQTCSATTSGGTKQGTTSAIRIDQTPPASITAATSRPADFAGWYTSPVTIGWSGTDALSGVASCTRSTYSGPDSAGAPLTGTCSDSAGNTSAPLTVTLAYDATAPSVSDVKADAGDTTASFNWKTSPDTKTVTVVVDGDTVYQGAGTAFLVRGLTNGVTHTGTVTAFDAAGNAASQSVSFTPNSRLLGPLPNTKIPVDKARARPPRLAWQPRAGASYYNVQLFRRIHGHWRKVLSRWPEKNHFQLTASWIYGGRVWKLAAGRYRWFVWPGYGPRSRHSYGKLLGKRDFIITAG
jgi:hypothetical protein